MHPEPSPKELQRSWIDRWLFPQSENVAPDKSPDRFPNLSLGLPIIGISQTWRVSHFSRSVFLNRRGIGILGGAVFLVPILNASMFFLKWHFETP